MRTGLLVHWRLGTFGRMEKKKKKPTHIRYICLAGTQQKLFSDISVKATFHLVTLLQGRTRRHIYTAYGITQSSLLLLLGPPLLPSLWLCVPRQSPGWHLGGCD